MDAKGSTTFGKMLLKSKNDEDEPLSKSLTLPKLDQARDLFYKVAEITPQQIVHFLNERIRVQFTQLTGNDPSSDLFPVLQQLRDFHVSFPPLKCANGKVLRRKHQFCWIRRFLETLPRFRSSKNVNPSSNR